MKLWYIITSVAWWGAHEIVNPFLKQQQRNLQKPKPTKKQPTKKMRFYHHLLAALVGFQGALWEHIGIIKSKSWPCVGHPKNTTTWALSKRSLSWENPNTTSKQWALTAVKCKLHYTVWGPLVVSLNLFLIFPDIFGLVIFSLSIKRS